MDQTVVAMLTGACSEETGHLWLWRSANFSDDVAGGWSSVRAEEERVERGG